MGFVIGLLTVVLVLDCVLLILLVLIQLPKKEAGAGLAFGGAASDALFGAGSGNTLTKITKYAAGIFFVLAIGLGLLQGAFSRRATTSFQEELERQAKQATTTLPGAQPTAPAALPAATNLPVSPAGTNAPARPAATPPAVTNPPAR